MADGRAFNRNDARAIRVMEIVNDFRTLQHHISGLLTRREAAPPDQQSAHLDGYALLRQCNAESQALLSTMVNLGDAGIRPGQVSQTEAQKATLQRIILDASTRRFQTHKVYLRTAAAMRWVQLRTQLLRGEKATSRHAAALRTIDQRFREELSQITNQHIYSDLRAADRRKGYWLDEDPSLERMLAWIQR